MSFAGPDYNVSMHNPWSRFPYLRTRFSRLAVIALLAALPAIASAQPQRHYRVTIVAPKSEQSIFSNPGNAEVRVRITPRLAHGDMAQLWLDGAPLPPARLSGKFSLSGLGPGRHSVQARVVDAQDNELARSGERTFYMRHASRLYPNRRGG